MTDKRRIGYVTKYNKKFDQLTIRPPKGSKDRWRAAAATRGMSLTQLIIATMEKEIAADPVMRAAAEDAEDAE